MAGAIIENMSSRKLAILGGILLVCQVCCRVKNYVMWRNNIKEIYILRTRSEKCKIWEIYNLLSEQHVWSCFYTGAVLHGGGDICTESKQLWSIFGHMVQGQKFFFLLLGQNAALPNVSIFLLFIYCCYAWMWSQQDPDGLSKGKHEHEAWFVPRGKNKCQV